jgi:hypothetical protein
MIGETNEMSANKTKWRYPLIFIFTFLLLTFPLAACIAPDEPLVLSSEGEAVEAGDVVEATPGEAPPVEVEEADVAALVTGEPAEEAAEDAAGDATATPQGVAAVPTEGATADEGLAAEIGFTDVLVSANYFINREVKNLAGDVIADVDDLLIDLDTGQVIYVIVNYGGFLDLTDEDRPLPLSAFGWNQDLELVLRLPEDVLATVPAVEDEWPAGVDPEWNTATLTYWQDAGFFSEFNAEVVPVRVTTLIGLHAGQVGSELGVVEDLLLDLSREQAAYLGIFTTDGFYSPDLVLLVPFSATDLELEVVGDEPIYGITLLEVDPEVLRSAPALERALFSTVDFIDQSFTQELDAYWSEQGYEVRQPE